MQTPKKSLSKNGASDIPKRSSPKTPRSARQTNTSVAAPESDSAASPCSGSKTPINKSPRVVERRSPKSSMPEKIRPNRIKELESQLAQLKEDLKKTKDQLVSSESCKSRAEQETEEASKQFMAVNAKLEEAQRQLKEISESEDLRIHELRMIGQDRDRAWQSELEAVQKQHAVDSAALFSAMNEIHNLKRQLEIAANPEVSEEKEAETVISELEIVKQNLTETRLRVNSLENQLEASEKSESECQKLFIETKVQLDVANATIETLKSDCLKTLESFNSLTIELEESKNQISSLEKNVEIDGQLDNDSSILPDDDNNEVALRTQLNSLQSEIEELKFALETAEMKYQEEQIKCTMQIHSAYEAMERYKIESNRKEDALLLALGETKVEISALNEKETEVQGESLLNKQIDAAIETELELEVGKSMEDIAELKAKLMGKESELQSILEENQLLKLAIEKGSEGIKNDDIAKSEVKSVRFAEPVSFRKIETLPEESEECTKKADVINEQLESAKAKNSEMEAELRKLRVQTDQWRKAAEAAAAILSSGNNGMLVERSGSLDSDYNSIRGKLLNSPFSDDLEEESPKKKINMLKKIGVLWKKGQK